MGSLGVGGVPEAADEYDAYLGQIVKRLRDGASPEDLARFLTQLATDQLGLAARPDDDLAVAREMRDWYDASTARWAKRRVR